MNLDGALQTFFAEAEELLTSMEAALLRVDEGAHDAETLNEIFRAAHTIKGSAGLFGLHSIVGFTHIVENLLDQVRSGTMAIDRDLLSLLLNCRDHMAGLVRDVMNQEEPDVDRMSRGDQLLKQLMQRLGSGDSAEPAAASAEPVVEEVAHGVPGTWHLSLRFGPDTLRNGMDPLSFIRFLHTLGEITQLVTLDDHLPEAADYDPETLYLGFEIDLLTEQDRTAIDDVFEFVREGSDIRILPPDSKIEEYIQLIHSLPEAPRRLGDILVQSGALSPACLERALQRQSTQDAPQRLGEILAAQHCVPEQVIETALDQQKKVAERKAAPENRTIRVDAEKLDSLINLIGELVITRQRVDLLSFQTGHVQLLESVAQLKGFTEQIRDAALALRMVQIGDTFQRFKRVVRDVAQELGKSIDLVIAGAETELDRSMVEKLTDPLTHIVRNAIDHGIEPVDVRRQRGKSDTGTLRLTACHDSGNIVIEISDDGGGLNLDKIRAKAIANGLIDATTNYSDHDLFQLIFHPGLSTAERVTNLSGRGVGMDVVKRNIEALQGGIDIDSVPGEGTRFRIRLPLTLAIIDGFHVASRNTHFIIPQNTVLECMDLAALHQVKGRACVNLRGEQVPYIRLSDLFALRDSERHGDERAKLVVVQFGQERSGIVVDELHGEIQTVVKPLSPIFQALKGIGGSSLLGTGDIAFILDIPQLIELAIARESRRVGKSAVTQERAS